MLHRPSLTPTAIRSARKRARRRLGVVVYRVPAHEGDVIEALIRNRRLSEAETRQTSLIETW
jgi:hypothetical protein